MLIKGLFAYLPLKDLGNQFPYDYKNLKKLIRKMKKKAEKNLFINPTNRRTECNSVNRRE